MGQLQYTPEFSQASDRITLWRWDPELFVNEALRLPQRGFDYKISSQQKAGLAACRDISLSKYKVYEYGRLDGRLKSGEIGKTEHRELKQFFFQKRDDWLLSKKTGVCIMSGRGSGKTAMAAWITWWRLYCFNQGLVLCTSPKKEQMKDNLWAALRKWGSGDGSNPDTCPVFMQQGKEQFEILSDKIYQKNNVNQQAIARTINQAATDDVKSETFRGYHDHNMIYVIDEGTGVPDSVYSPLETGLTQAGNWCLIISNFTRRNGYAADIHLKANVRKYWVALDWNCEESELVSKSSIEKLKDIHGEDSDKYRVEVQGKPPRTNPDSFISSDWVENAAMRKVDPTLVQGKPRLMGVDVARGGDAYSVIALRQGYHWERFYRFKTDDTRDLAQIVKAKYAEWFANYLFLDVAGMGAPIYDSHFRSDHTIQTVQFSAAFSAQDKNTYYRLGDEVGIRMRDAFEQGLLQIPDDRDLKEELTSRNLKDRDDGKIKLEGKREMRARGLPSPDRMDAFMMTYMFPEEFYDIDESEDEYQAFCGIEGANPVTGY